MTYTSDANFWNNAAARYAARPVKNMAAFERKQAITRARLHADATVLEIGCGSGSLALAMSQFARHIVALDISDEMIRIAEQKKQAQGVTNVSFKVGALDTSSQYEPASFDCIWAYSILHLLPDRQRTLQILFDLLKPGGTLISSNPCLGETWIPYGPIIRLMHWLGKAPSVHVFDRKTLFRELSEAGFVEIEERDVGAEKLVAFVLAEKPR